MFNDLLKIGLIPLKSKRIALPDIPPEYLSDFLRGYFDGDGCVSFEKYSRKTRKSKARLLSTRFTSGSKSFLKNLLKTIKECVNIKGGFVTTKKGAFELAFSVNDSKILYNFMYGNASSEAFLARKYNKFQNALRFLGA